jgi:hypothetical protein
LWLQRNGFSVEKDNAKDEKHLQNDEMRFKEDEAMVEYEKLSGKMRKLK